MTETFFDEPLKQSKVKIQIVANYFQAWARIIADRATTIAYVDLFAGQGYYEDGTESTPILILKKAVEDPKIAQRLQSEFNDLNTEYIQSLHSIVKQIKGIEKLYYAPNFSNITVTKEIVRKYSQMALPPTFFFFDPWGYKGVFLDLIKVTIKDWGSECLLFFNYKRINMDLNKNSVDRNINELFGKDLADKLRQETKGISPYKREETIIQRFCEALTGMGAKYTLPFCFRDRKKDRTSHYLIHATKHPLGYGLMKEIMDKYSIKDEDRIPTFTFDPKNQLTLNFSQKLSMLCKQLICEFEGQTLKVEDIYKRHQAQTRFVQRNYKDSLKQLEKEGKITVDKPAAIRPVRDGKRTLGDKRVVTFIGKGK